MSNCAEVRFHFVKKKTSCFPYCKSEICHGNERIRARPLCTRSNTIKICRIQLVTRWEFFFTNFEKWEGKFSDISLVHYFFVVIGRSLRKKLRNLLLFQSWTIGQIFLLFINDLEPRQYQNYFIQSKIIANSFWFHVNFWGNLKNCYTKICLAAHAYFR